MTEVPEGYNLKDWNIGNLSCEGATMVKGVLSGNTYTAKFNRQDLQGVNAGDAVPLTVKGTFTFKGKQAQIQSYDMVHVVKYEERGRDRTVPRGRIRNGPAFSLEVRSCRCSALF